MATCLINRTPSPLLSNTTPFELLYKKVVNYGSLKVFGYLTFASILFGHRTKFQPRARMCVFLGYPIGMKAYKLYDIDTRHIFFSRDVVFQEKIFPLSSIKLPEPHVDPLHSGFTFPSSFQLQIPPSPTMSSYAPTSPSTQLPDSPTISPSPTPPVDPQLVTTPSLFPSRRSHGHTQPPSSETIITISCLIPLLILIILCILYLKCYPLMLFSSLIDSLLLLYLFILNSNLQ